MNGILTHPDTGELLVENRTLAFGQADLQTAAYAVRAVPGAYKHAPLAGASAATLVGSPADPVWCGRTRRMLRSLGLPVDRVETQGQDILVTLNTTNV